MGITAALDHLADVEAGLSITSPVALQIRRVFPYPPAGSYTLNDFPCVMNNWAFLSSTEEAWGFRLDRYTVQVQLFVDDANQERGFRIVTAFAEALANALFREPGPPFQGGVFDVTLRGAGPSLGRLEWAGKSYPGLTLFFDMSLVEDADP